jgi:hypothetical protein
MYLVFRLLLDNHCGKLAPFGLDRRRLFVRRFKGLLSQLNPADVGQFRLSEVGSIERAITKAVINAHWTEGRLLWWIADVATKKLPDLERQEDWAEIRQRMARLGFPDRPSPNDRTRPVEEEHKQLTVRD